MYMITKVLAELSASMASQQGPDAISGEELVADVYVNTLSDITYSEPDDSSQSSSGITHEQGPSKAVVRAVELL
jgi:hypothetical protein